MVIGSGYPVNRIPDSPEDIISLCLLRFAKSPFHATQAWPAYPLICLTKSPIYQKVKSVSASDDGV